MRKYRIWINNELGVTDLTATSFTVTSHGDLLLMVNHDGRLSATHAFAAGVWWHIEPAEGEPPNDWNGAIAQ